VTQSKRTHNNNFYTDCAVLKLESSKNSIYMFIYLFIYFIYKKLKLIFLPLINCVSHGHGKDWSKLCASILISILSNFQKYSNPNSLLLSQ
jgi:hypothetical protein